MIIIKLSNTNFDRYTCAQMIQYFTIWMHLLTHDSSPDMNHMTHELA